MAAVSASIIGASITYGFGLWALGLRKTLLMLVSLLALLLVIFFVPDTDLGKYFANVAALVLLALFPTLLCAAIGWCMTAMTECMQSEGQCKQCRLFAVYAGIVFCTFAVVSAPSDLSGLRHQFREQCVRHLSWSPIMREACKNPGDMPEICEKISHLDVVNTNIGPPCHAWCRDFDMYLPFIAHSHGYACLRVYVWRALALPPIRISIPGSLMAASLAACAYGLLSFKAVVARLLWNRTMAETQGFETLPSQGPEHLGPSPTSFLEDGPFAKPAMLLERFCKYRSASDLEAERLRLIFTFLPAAVEPASDIFSITTLLAQGQPSYAAAMLAMVILPNIKDPFQQQFGEALVDSYDRGYPTEHTLRHQLREGTWEAYVGSIVAVCALMRTPSLNAISVGSLMFNVALSVVLSIPGAARTSAVLTDPSVDVDDYYDISRRSAGLMAIAPVFAWGLCSPSFGIPALICCWLAFCALSVCFMSIEVCLDTCLADKANAVNYVLSTLMYGSPLMLRDFERERWAGGNRAQWLGPCSVRVVVATQDVMLFGLYCLLAHDVLTGQAYVPPQKQGDVAWQEHMIQTVFLVLGSGAALLVVTMDLWRPPQGWIEPADPGEYEVLQEGLPVFARPVSTAEIVQRLEFLDVIEISELSTAAIAQQPFSSEDVETPANVGPSAAGAPGHGCDDDGDREMFRNAALVGKVADGWVALRSSKGNFLAQKFLEKRAAQQ